MERELDKRDSVKVVTKNEFVTADGISQLSLNARKLLYLAIAQCRRTDTEFYEYSATPEELAEMWGITRQRIYQTADEITDELMRVFIRSSKAPGKHFKKRHVFSRCEYDDDSRIVFSLDSEMASMLLKITGDFTQPPLSQFMKMRSKYSISIWHLMQREMKSMLPRTDAPIEFELTMEELRQATATKDKFRLTGHFKERVLDQAIKEIRENLLANISYIDVKQGRRITGFRFTAESVFGTVKIDELTLRERKVVRKAQLIHLKSCGTITTEELRELQHLQEELYQMNIEDVYGKHVYR